MKKLYKIPALNPPRYQFGHVLMLLAVVIMISVPISSFSQPTPFSLPTVSYSGPQVYTAGTAITPLTPTSTGVASPGYNDPAVFSSDFMDPEHIVLDNAGNVYIADFLGQKITKIPAGGGSPVIISSGVGHPESIGVDANGNVYAIGIAINQVTEFPAGGGPSFAIGSGFNNPTRLAADAAGNVYVVDPISTSVKKIPAGNGPVVQVYPGPGGGSANIAAIAVDPAGNLFIIDHSSFLLELPAGSTELLAITNSLSANGGLAVDAAGNIYITDVNTTLYEFIPGTGNVTISNTLKHPLGVAVDSAGNIYAGNANFLFGSDRGVRKITPNGGYFINKVLPAGLHFDETTGIISGTPLANTSSPATNYIITAWNSSGHASATVNITVNPILVPAISYSSPQTYVIGTPITPLTLTNTGGAAAPAGYSSTATLVSGFVSPQAIGLDAAGNLYAVDLGGSAIFKLPAGGGAAVLIAPVGAEHGFQAQNIAVSAAGDVFTYDLSSGSVLKFPADGSPGTTLASGLVLSAALAVDAAGNVYAGDLVNNAILKIPARGNPVTINSGSNIPTDIAIDATGNIFFNTGSALFRIPAGGGAPVSVPITGPFSGIINNGLAIDGSENIFFPSQNSIVEIPGTGAGVININTGSSSPRWLAINAANQLYVGDSGSHLIYKVTPAGGYYINPGLPLGLIFDGSTGSIGGVPGIVNPPTDYRVTAYNSSGAGSATINIALNPHAPTVSSFSPASGPVGTPVTINGTNLSNPTALTIGGQNAITVSNTGSVLVAMVMPGAATGGITFSTAGGSAAVTGGFTVTATLFPSAQQRAKLIATDNSGGSMLGASVAVSADGNTAIMGGPADNSGTGAAWIFTRSGGVWTQQGAKLVGTGSVGAAAQGTSVAISADGNTAIIGGPADNNQQGAVWVFTRSGAVWTQQGTKLLGSDNFGPANQGFALSVSADGNTAVEGGYHDRGGIGAAWVFTRIEGIWAQQTTKLAASDAGPSANQGYSVAISADAGTILVGAPADNTNTGGAWFYTKAGNAWSQAGHEKQGSSVIPQARQGFSVALSADGNTGIIGGNANNSGQGAAWVFFRFGGNDWIQQPVLTDQGLVFEGLVGAGNVGAAGQGASVALSADGNLAMTGGPADNTNAGAAWIFQRNNSLWVPKGTKISGTGSTGAAMQSSSLALSADGSTAISGGPADNSGKGAAWPYIILAAPTIQATNVVFTNTTTTATTASWTNGNGMSRAVFMSAAASGSPAPVDSTVYTANSIFGAGTQIGSSGWYCVYNGIGSFANITGLIQGTTYRVMTVEYNSGAGDIKYLAVAGTNNPNNVTTLALPAISYSSPQTYHINAAITPLAPVSSGVAAPAYNSSPVIIGSGFNLPAAIAIDAAGNLFIINIGDKTLKKIPAGGGSPVTLATGINEGYGVAADTAGNVYISELNNNIIKKIPAGGGSPVIVASGFHLPAGIALDTKGNLYVVDRGAGDHLVYKVPLGVNPVTPIPIGGSGFSDPAGVAVDAAGNVFVADVSTGNVYRVPADGGATATLASGFSNPSGVAVDAIGNVFVADFGNNVIKEIPAGGGAPLIVGGATGVFNHNFAQPDGVVTDGAGNVYVADLGHNAIKEMVPVGGYYISSSLPAGLNFDGSTGVISGTPTVLSPATNYTVTAYNSDGSSSAAVNIKVVANNANLADLVLSSGALSPSFASGTTSYTAVVAKTTASITITPTADDTTAAVKINGTPVASGSASGAIPLATGDNVITALVTAQDGVTTKTYTLTVTRLGNLPYVNYSGPQTYLTGVTITPLSPLSFGVAAPAYSTTLVNVGSGFSNPDGIAVDLAGNIYVADFGNNLVKKIPAGGGNPIAIGAGFVRPTAVAVDAAGNVYVADYGNGAIKEIPHGGGAPITVATGFSGPDGIAVDATGNLYVADQLSNLVQKIPAGGGNKVTIGSGFSFPTGVAVDALGNVFVADLFNNAVKKIPAGGGAPMAIGTGFSGPTGVAIDPAGNVYVADYYNNAIKKINLIGGSTAAVAADVHTPFGIAIDGSGKVYVTDASENLVKKITPSGGYYLSPALPAGLAFNGNNGSITGKPTMVSPPTNYTITAYNGFGSSSGTLNIAVMANASLAALTVTGGGLAPVFAAGITSYTDTVSNTTTLTKVKPTTSDAAATVKVNGVAVVSGTPSSSLPLSVGSNTITTVVTAIDGTTTKTYTITVVRLASPNANLASLKTDKAALSPLFKPALTSYTALVGNAVTAIKVLPVAALADAVIMVNGSPVASGAASPAIPLSAGPNTLSVVVTAPDGITKKTYTITVTRAPSANASLASLTISSGTLNPGFSSGHFSYTVAVGNATTSVTLTPVTSDAFATVKVSGVTVASGSPSADQPLAVGTNKITEVVTAQDGVSTKTYSVTVTRAPLPPVNSLYQPVSVTKPAERTGINDLIVHQGISPNGDGQNDVLTIDGITNYPDSKLIIMNRSGQLVYEAKGYDNTSKVFDGHSNKTGQLQLPGTYFYSLEYTVKGVTKRKAGFIVLKY